jgi:tRNA threonylcarbamoyladenosine biosynthesis protein TsaB
VIVLGFDTATSSTAVALRMGDESMRQVRDDPALGEHPGHATRLLPMVGELLAQENIDWSALERIAVGLGPGAFTGLRVGVATARGLAQSLGIELVGVSSLQALAVPALRESGGSPVLAVLDARRGEAFVAPYLATDQGSVRECMLPRALAPEDLGDMLAQAEGQLKGDHGEPWRAIGDGAVRFRNHLEDVGVVVPPDSSALHILSAEMICDLGVCAIASDETIVPNYLRRPDAEIALEGTRALKVAQGSQITHAAGVGQASDEAEG